MIRPERYHMLVQAEKTGANLSPKDFDAMREYERTIATHKADCEVICRDGECDCGAEDVKKLPCPLCGFPMEYKGRGFSQDFNDVVDLYHCNRGCWTQRRMPTADPPGVPERGEGTREMTPEERADRITAKWGKLRDAVGYRIEYDLVKEIQEAQTEAFERACGAICADCSNGRNIQYWQDGEVWVHHLDDGLHYDFCKAYHIRRLFGPFTNEPHQRTCAVGGNSEVTPSSPAS